MIKSVLIKNFILIDELFLEFENGFNVLTGETGAGKSIILKAIDTVMKNPDADMEEYYQELLKVGNRGYTTGFYLGEGYPKDGYSYDISKGLAGADFLCEIHDFDGDFKIKTKNKFNKNEDIEIISPSEKFVTQVTEIKNLKDEDLELANTNDELLVKFTRTPKEYKYALARTVGIK